MAFGKARQIPRCYQKLVELAIREETITYEDLARYLGTATEGNALGAQLSPILSHLYRFCEAKGLPKLTSLVVRKSGGARDIPGKGFWAFLIDEGLHTEQSLTLELRQELTRIYHRDVFAYHENLFV